MYQQPKKSGCGKAAGCTCGGLAALGLIVAGVIFYFYSFVGLSQPVALTGIWKIVKSDGEFGRDAIGDGFEIVPGDNVAIMKPKGVSGMSVDLKPDGTRKFKGELTNPADPTKKAVFNAELDMMGKQLTIKVDLAGKQGSITAERDLEAMKGVTTPPTK
jgi:hypothetical protein